MYLTHWYIVLIGHENEVCEDSIASVYAGGGYCGLGKSVLCVFGKLCPVGFLVVCECSSFFAVCSHVVC